VLGKARKLITSFEARPNDDLLMAVDLRGSYRREKPFWNASVLVLRRNGSGMIWDSCPPSPRGIADVIGLKVLGLA
jgi:hypothetical protein